MRYLELETDADVDRFVGAARARWATEARQQAYWDECPSRAYVRAGRPLPPGNETEWSPQRGFHSTGAVCPGVEIFPLSGGGALVEVNVSTRGSKRRLRAWLNARPLRAANAVTGRFRTRLQEIEVTRPTPIQAHQAGAPSELGRDRPTRMTRS